MTLAAGVLARDDIINGHKSGDLIIEPFVAANLTTVALDVTLGSDAYFVSSGAGGSVVDLSSKLSIRESWTLKDTAGTSGITIAPGETVLCHTHEFVGSRAGVPITTLLRARSSVARAGLAISPSAGWGDIGFHGRWGMVITNIRINGPPVFIPWGMRVAQIVFLATSSAPTAKESYDGSYKVDLSNDWHPSMLLP